jgi:hypothetical protein
VAVAQPLQPRFPGGGRHITDFRHGNRDETDVIMTKIREK